MATASPKIQFLFNGVQFSLRDRKKLKRFIQLIFKKEKRKLKGLTYVFSNDKFIRSLNRAFLRHDYNTDILTFPMETNQGISAEIHISIETVKANARAYKVTLPNELLRVMFHGVLHLCGYKDDSSQQKRKMTKAEDHYLALFESFT